jgi:hypothetical protein
LVLPSPPPTPLSVVLRAAPAPADSRRFGLAPTMAIRPATMSYSFKTTPRR